MIGWLIIGCEIAFWVFVISGLFMRYILRKRKVGGFLLICTPISDLVLILFTVIDLKNGATADFFHGLAAIYIGVTIAFGHRMIKWADDRFAYRFAGAPKPAKAPKYGKQRAKEERTGWYRHLLAWAIGSLLLFMMTLYIGDSSNTSVLTDLINTWAIILVIDFLISFSYTVWPKKEKATNSGI